MKTPSSSPRSLETARSLAESRAVDDRLSHRTAARTLITALATVALAACQHIDPVPLDPADVAHAFEARSLAELGLRDFVEQQTHSRVPTWPPQPLDLDTATLAALYFQPSLDVARAQRDVARGAIATAGQRPNPTLLLAPELSTNPGTAASPWTSALHLDWPIETAHKRKHRIARADALASASERALSAEAWRVRLALRLAFADAEVGRRRAASLRDRGRCRGAARRPARSARRRRCRVARRRAAGAQRLARDAGRARRRRAQPRRGTGAAGDRDRGPDPSARRNRTRGPARHARCLARRRR